MNKKFFITSITLLLLSVNFFATNFTVTSTGDNGGTDPSPNAGTGTLRQAIVDAIDAGGTNTISFSISGTGPHTITLLATLPSFSNLTINGFTQSGAAANTGVIFTSAMNPTYRIIIKSGISGANTLFTLGSNNVIKGLVLEDCASAGTLITINGNGNQVVGCFIGMQSNGTSRGASNATTGIKINNVANNTIGDGTTAGANLISGMAAYGTGVLITGSSATGNTVKGNIIGLQKNGTTLVSTHYQLYGIKIESASGNNTIGGTGTYDGNVISGQYGQYGTGTKYYGVGILLNSNATAGNTVIGNRIGMQHNGTTAVSNNTQYMGIYILNSKNNTIGGNTAAHRNVISGNGPIPYQNQIWSCGILISGSTSTGNSIKGNYIGPKSDGMDYITSAIQFKGIIIRNAGTGNVIGGTASGEGNVLSGNTCNFGGNCGEGRGIVVKNSTVTITGNIIGLNKNGDALLGNAPTEKQYWGIELDSLATNNIIGGTTATTRNIISGNQSSGIKIGSVNPSGCTGNVVKGNYIGLANDGTTRINNNIQNYGVTISGATSNTIGGSNANEGNVISGNNYFGIYLSSSANSNTFWGNIIGTTVNGTWVTNNTQTRGINCENSANNIIGGNTSTKRNLISGNEDIGILLNGSTATGNQIKGNYIGTNAAGTAILTNPSNSSPQGVGVWTASSASSNAIGGTTSGEGNLISGNESGVQLNSNSNTVYGNIIGPQADGATNMTNNAQAFGVLIDGNNNTIGGNTSGHRNIISANTFYGVYIQNTSNGNSIKGNYIGASASLANITNSSQDYGVYIVLAYNNTIGGSNSGEENNVAFNTTNGVFISGNSAIGNKITRNPIYTNTGKAIELNYGANAGNNNKAAPIITNLTNTVVSGIGTNGDVIEVFKKPKTDCLDAKTYLGSTTVSGGTWTLSININTTTENVLATATDASNNTSEFTKDTPGQSTWTGAINTDWFNPGNWGVCGDGVPTATTEAIIPNGVSNKPAVNNNNANCKRLIVEGDATVEIQGNYTLTVNDN